VLLPLAGLSIFRKSGGVLYVSSLLVRRDETYATPKKKESGKPLSATPPKTVLIYGGENLLGNGVDALLLSDGSIFVAGEGIGFRRGVVEETGCFTSAHWWESDSDLSQPSPHSSGDPSSCQNPSPAFLFDCRLVGMSFLCKAVSLTSSCVPLFFSCLLGFIACWITFSIFS